MERKHPVFVWNTYGHFELISGLWNLSTPQKVKRIILGWKNSQQKYYKEYMNSYDSICIIIIVVVVVVVDCHSNSNHNNKIRSINS